MPPRGLLGVVLPFGRKPASTAAKRFAPRVEDLEGRALLTAGVAVFPAGPMYAYEIVQGSDGNLWVTGSDSNGNGAFVVHAPDGTIRATYSLATPFAVPQSPTLGPDGNIWFTEPGVGNIGKITPTGQISEYALPSTALQDELGPYPLVTTATAITSGPDGALWFTDATTPGLGRITTSGEITLFPAPGLQPSNLTVGSDGAIWFTSQGAVPSVDRFDPVTHAITTTVLPDANSWPSAIIPGPDGALWFLEPGTQSVGRITTSGVLTETPIRAATNWASTLTFDMLGDLWIAGDSAGLVRIAPSGMASTVPVGTDGTGSAVDVIQGPGQTLWFVDAAANGVGRVDPASVVAVTADDHPLSLGPVAFNLPVELDRDPHTVSGTIARLYDGNPSGVSTDFQATIDWGDGSTSLANILPASNANGFVINASHTYAVNGSYAVSLTVRDVNPRHVSSSQSINGTTWLEISDVTVLPPILNLGGGPVPVSLLPGAVPKSVHAPVVGPNQTFAVTQQIQLFKAAHLKRFLELRAPRLVHATPKRLQPPPKHLRAAIPKVSSHRLLQLRHAAAAHLAKRHR